MKKLAILLALALLLTCAVGCEKGTAPSTDPTTIETQPSVSNPTEPKPTEDDSQYITSDNVDLRQMVVDYMYAMANIRWTAGQTLDYSKYGANNLIYEAGQTYLGMVYNNNATGLEKFQSVLDENGLNLDPEIRWDSAAGNSCATSIRHAWQQISTTAGFGYSADMMPCYRYSGVVAIGDIDWSCYDRTHTKTVIEGNSRDVILEAYALTLPGDALVRHLGDAGGHALMITKAPTVVRNEDGSINLVNSYLYLTDQNNNLNNKRENPSSWTVDAKVSFSSALQDGYLPVTIAELRDGRTEVPRLELVGVSTAQEIAAGNMTGTVKSNYCINTVRLEIRSGEGVLTEVEAHPYETSFSLKELEQALKIDGLSAGEYTLVVIAEVGLATQTLLALSFSR